MGYFDKCESLWGHYSEIVECLSGEVGEVEKSSIITLKMKCSWCNGYRRRKWTRVQILDETDCISHSTNTLGKGMNLIILPPVMGKM